MAIRQDCNNVFEITNAAIAMLYHYTALKLKVLRHLYCAKGKDSCFKWQSDKETGEITYKKKLSLARVKQIKHIFEDLGDTKLPEKCFQWKP